MWHRHHAAQIVTLLPDNLEEALMVLASATELVEWLYRPQRRAPSVLEGSAAILPLRVPNT